jgi:mono/diheme cytochrome c family protein
MIMKRALIIVSILLFLAAARPGGGVVIAQDAPPTPMSGITMPPQKSEGLIMPDLGPDATQADYGAEVYRLVCKACHGDKGQGLTPDWIAQWAPEDQNCWQLKCHAANHPPEGFVLPHDIPPVVGESVTNRFVSAKQLHSYIVATMPWYAPGMLTDEEYWQATAYLLEQNGVNVGTTTVNDENAASLKFVVGTQAQDEASTVVSQTTPGVAATRQAQRTADLAAQEAARPGWPWGWIVLLLISMIGALWVLVTALRQI